MQYNTTSQGKNILFIKEKISEIKIALFKSDINSELKLPVNVIQTLKVEEDGTIWFFTTAYNNYYLKYIDKPFYAYLDYYKKGVDCRLKLSGHAIIVNDHTDDIYPINFPIESYNGVLVKMKIQHAEFFETNTYNNVTWADKIKSAVNHLFLPQHRTYNFS